MKELEVQSLGLKFKIMVPETIEEFDNLAKRQGAALDSAIKNETYRGVFTEWRPLFCDALEEATGVKRERDKDGNPTGVDKSEDAYTKRVYATIGSQATPPITDLDVIRQRYAGLAQEVANKDECKMDPSVTVRTGGGSNLVAKTYKLIATTAFEKGQLAALSAKLAAYGFPSNVTDDKDASILSVAKAIAAREAKKNEARQAEYEALAAS